MFRQLSLRFDSLVFGPQLAQLAPVTSVPRRLSRRNVRPVGGIGGHNGCLTGADERAYADRDRRDESAAQHASAQRFKTCVWITQSGAVTRSSHRYPRTVLYAPESIALR